MQQSQQGKIFRVSRKLRPRKLRPQTRKTQTLGCLENSDPKNSDPLGVSKTQTRKIKHIYTAWIPQADLFTVRYSGKIQNAKSAEKRKTAHSVRYEQWSWKWSAEKRKKTLAVLDTCNDHENYTQHSYRFFYPQRVVSLEAIWEVSLYFPHFKE